jgi:hypothetical protein
MGATNHLQTIPLFSEGQMIFQRRQAMARTLLATVLILSATIAFASTDSNGPNGILSTGLNGYNTNEELTGFEVSIGQVEPTRPGKSTPPPADSPSHSNSFITPAAVFVHQDPPLTADDATIDNHAEQVAGVMISMDERADVNGVKPVGVAQDVQLYSTAYVTSGTAGYQNALLAMQFIAEQNGDDVRAINNSWGKPLPSGASIDGNSQLTLGFDYLAKKHDVLYIVAGNEDAGGLPTPADNFNGMTIAGATRGPDDKYDTVDDRNNLNDHPIADRTGVSLLAPADSILVTGLNNAQATVGGTSIAAPQVTGTVALLQQYGNQRLTAANSLHWSDDYKQHTVMKAVLMNSADKISKQSDLPVQVAGVATLPVPTGGFLDQDKYSLSKGRRHVVQRHGRCG